MQVGILAIQGDVAAHARSLSRLGAHPRPLLSAEDLAEVDALVLPGGESTTIAKGLDRLQLYQPLQMQLSNGLPVLGTCAGAILLAKNVLNHPITPLGVADISIERNAYGTQVDSFITKPDPDSAGDLADLDCVFIRAPIIRDVASNVTVLLRVANQPVLVQQNNLLIATFHPELTEDLSIHRLLLQLI